MRFRPALAALGLLLAGCGGSHVSTLPPADRALQPQLNGGTGSLARPTLYVAGQGSVFAYDLTASGDAAPISKSGGYYYSALVQSSSIAGIATNSAGDLVVVQNNGTNNGYTCQIVLIQARTSADVNQPIAHYPCVPYDFNGVGTYGHAVGVTFTGGPTGPGNAFTDDIDVLMHYELPQNSSDEGCNGISQSQYEVDRYRVIPGSISPMPCIVLSHAATAGSDYHAIAGSTNGAFFVDYSSVGASDTIERYASIPGPPTNTAPIPGAGALAVSANPVTNVGHRVVASTVGNATTIYSFTMSGISMTFNHALGTFTNPVAALAVDNDGKIYVGIDQPNGVTKVKVYGPSKTEATNPDSILNNPVRRPNPAATPEAGITGMAIAQ